MKMLCKAFGKKLFGADYERLTRPLLIYVIVFWGLSVADFDIQIAPSVLYLTASAFTSGVMWQALSSKSHAVQLRNMLMLPFDRRKFVFSYTASSGAYTLFTKTAGLLAVMWGVSAWTFEEISGSILCAVNAVLLTAALYALKNRCYAGIPWTAALAASILCWGNKPWFMLVPAASGALAALLLQSRDGYDFYQRDSRISHMGKGHTRCLMWRYFFRYLTCHRNYLANTAVMWGVACVLPLFFRQMKGLPVIPMGFAILSINTPVCILLSCDPALEQAVRVLPGQKKAFFIPYCLFLFLCNMTADIIFLCSLLLRQGSIALPIPAALFFSLQSALSSVLLEWFCPLRNWKIESNLWHHPRKYLVPTAMLLLAGAVGALPGLMFVFIILLAVEIAVFLLVF